MNIFGLFQVIYQSIAKVATNDLKVDVYDLCLVRVCVGIFLPGIPILYYSGKRPFADILPDLKVALHIRNFLGIAGFTTLVYAAKYLPIFVV